MVAGVAAAGLGDAGHVVFEVGAGEVVEQEVVGGAEEVFLFVREVLFEGGFVDEQAVQAAIEAVFVGHARVGVEQGVHGGLGEPFFVAEEFAARGQEAIDGEEFEDEVPGHVAGLVSQGVVPEGVEAEVGPDRVGWRPSNRRSGGARARRGSRV